MTCDEVRELLPAYADRELRVADEVDAHLASCEACSAELARYREIAAGLEELSGAGEAPRPEFLQRALSIVPATPLTARLLTTVQEHPFEVGLAVVGAAATVAALAWRRRRVATAS